jgi:hypothetical protein
MSELPSNNDLESIRILMNNTPEEDFLGLSPNDMHDLLYNTFGEDSPLKISASLSDEILDHIPFFRLTEEFLKLLARDKKIKLTPLGALPKKVLTELYTHRLILSEGVESGIHTLTREHDWNALEMTHYNLLQSRLIRRINGKLVLTKEASKLLLPANRAKLFTKILQAYTEKLSWSAIDGYPEVPVGNLGWGFTILLLLKYGSEPREMKFYSNKYLKAFPFFMRDFQNPYFGTPEEYFMKCYTLRSFPRFLEWWGFVEIEKDKTRRDSENLKTKARPILALVFEAV